MLGGARFDEPVFQSLAEAVQASDAVVLAHATGNAELRQVVVNERVASMPGFHEAGIARFLDADFVIDEVLTGDLANPRESQLALDMFLPEPADPASLAARIPSDPVILFVHFKRDPGNDRFYRTANEGQSVFVEQLGGLVPRYDLPGDWTEEWSGGTLEEFATAIRSVVGTGNR